jgi:multidrug resistance efflux pump
VARIERSEATVRQLGAELEAARVSLLASNDQGRAAWRDELRRFQTEEEQRRLAVLEIGVRIESDEVELESRELDLTRAGSLLDDLLIPQAEYDRIRLWRDLVRRRLDESRALQDQTEQEYKVARARRQDYERGLPEQPGAEPLLRPLSEAMTVESERLREIRARREATVLRSPIAGQVNQILCRQGQTVVPGETILTVIDRNAGEIIAYLSESDDRQVRLDAPVLVSSLKRPEKSAESFVVRVGAGLQPLPERLWREPAVPDYGRAVVIAAVPNLPLSPGELLNVRFLDER